MYRYDGICVMMYNMMYMKQTVCIRIMFYFCDDKLNTASMIDKNKIKEKLKDIIDTSKKNIYIYFYIKIYLYI